MNEEVEKVEITEASSAYIAPEIESVITADDLAREVHYAGAEDGVSLLRP